MIEFFLLALLGLILIAVLYVVIQYNGLVSLRNHIAESWSDVDTELKRRHDLIPNLVSTVRGYASHEQAVLDRVTELRASASSSGGRPGVQSAEEVKLGAALGQIFVLAENYPSLKADQNFRQLQSELVITEDRIQAARRFFNGNVRDYRNKAESFPSSLIAGAFGFGPIDFFNMDPVFRQAPQVGLSGR